MTFNDADEIRALFSERLGEGGECVSLIPPFYTPGLDVTRMHYMPRAIDVFPATAGYKARLCPFVARPSDSKRS